MGFGLGAAGLAISAIGKFKTSKFTTPSLSHLSEADKAKMSKEQLEDLGYQIDWFTYPMAHAVVPEEIDDIYHFLGRIIK